MKPSSAWSSPIDAARSLPANTVSSNGRRSVTPTRSVLSPRLGAGLELGVDALDQRVVLQVAQTALQIGDVERRVEVVRGAPLDRAVAEAAVAFHDDGRELALDGLQHDAAARGLIGDHDARGHVAALDVEARQLLPQRLQRLERDRPILVRRRERLELVARRTRSCLRPRSPRRSPCRCARAQRPSRAGLRSATQQMPAAGCREPRNETTDATRTSSSLSPPVADHEKRRPVGRVRVALVVQQQQLRAAQRRGLAASRRASCR